ncbi:DsrH/TusB family sulfur metabolism protein [Methylomonas sp. MgM2]
MLHLIAQNSISAAVADRIAADDDLILQSGAVWAAFKGHKDNPLLSELLKRGCHIFVLRDVLSVGGIAVEQLLHGVQSIDYLKFVELTEKNTVIQTWC